MFSHEFERVPVSYDRKLITPQTYQTAIATRERSGLPLRAIGSEKSIGCLLGIRTYF